jgi:GNAT superfamily N-acetyltransferase
MAPNEWRMGGLETLKMYPMLLTWRTAIIRGLRLLAKVEEIHPEEPHWYLAALGTAPEQQGKGEASAALAPVLQRCDDEGVPAYLESSKESNLPFYRRHGFEVTTELRVPGGPVFYPMWRDPRPSA